MLCPICRRHQTNKIVTAKFKGGLVQGEVCDKCCDIAHSMTSEQFYNIFFNRLDSTCRFCGRAISEIEESLLVGCQRCYSEFYTEISSITQRLQGIDIDEG